MQMPKNQTSIILDSIADGVFTVDLDWNVTSFNRAAQEITGISKEDAIGRKCWEVFKANICEKKCALKNAMDTGRPLRNRSVYIVDFEGNRVPVSISAAVLRDENGRIIGGVETFRDLSLLEELKKEINGRKSFFDIVSKNKEMHRLFAILERVAQSESTVILQGESGTGKELFARAIHSLSARKERPMVTINLGALPDTLIESEIFGHKAGAFTGAARDRKGRVAEAEGGTLFLDEIGDLSLHLQVKLLRLLQEKTYEPVGEDRTVHADIRIIAATNKDLNALVRKGSFREDLFYRINVLGLSLPPLRERREDISLLIDTFLRKFKFLKGKETKGLSQEVLSVLMAYDYPGNVRELENIIEHAMVLCPGEVIGVRCLPDYLQTEAPSSRKGEGKGSKGESLRWKDMEREFILQALKINGWNRKQTANELGIGRQTLWRKIKRLNIKAPRREEVSDV